MDEIKVIIITKDGLVEKVMANKEMDIKILDRDNESADKELQKVVNNENMIEVY